MMSSVSSRSPNLLVIVTDQQRFDALSVHGGLAVTPNLDRLAGQSVDLRAHFSQCPVCGPSRAVMFTGQYPERTGVGENHLKVAPDRLSIFTRLQEEGYQLGYAGKDHLFPADGRPTFDHWHSGAPDPAHARYREWQALVDQSKGWLSSRGCHASGIFHDLPDELTTTGVIGAESVRFLQEATVERPFFHVASFFDPHVPHLAPRRFQSLYDESAIHPPDVGDDPVAGKHRRFRIKRSIQGADRATRAEKQRYLAVYASMVSFVDEQVGHILAALDARPDAANTVVLFTSDHGDFGFQYGMCKKDLVLLDALLHVPLLVRLPQSRASGREVAVLTEHVDLAPTLLEFAGLPIDHWMQGRSLVPLLRGEITAHKTEVFGVACPPGYANPYADAAAFRAAWAEGQRTLGEHPLKRTADYNLPGDHCTSIRTDHWKLIRFEDGFEELYDLQADPEELRNLAPDSDFSIVLHTLRRRLCDHAAAASHPVIS
ncbi:sulfatase family protein [Synoicihabitans lomoniglobus]|uniref:Sulfatase-like hydrolase/transferase n=1 Tax=Synoicihabitans lomoniglobus TaxID=2909285 RepID=A0AAF0CMF0_9BACT|nr:sulfatase-like hydrolase/transferase [Opitutaceae bacterium LMO-M01]WED63186.1 sulfatase-like hydrolase/transferase [Opitutaceae bacterium LMO-M01]